jgi:hypothetical protein
MVERLVVAVFHIPIESLDAVSERVVHRVPLVASVKEFLGVLGPVLGRQSDRLLSADLGPVGNHVAFDRDAKPPLGGRADGGRFELAPRHRVRVGRRTPDPGVPSFVGTGFGDDEVSPAFGQPGAVGGLVDDPCVEVFGGGDKSYYPNTRSCR